MRPRNQLTGHELRQTLRHVLLSVCQRQCTWQAQRNTVMHRTLQPYLLCTYHCPLPPMQELGEQVHRKVSNTVLSTLFPGSPLGTTWMRPRNQLTGYELQQTLGHVLLPVCQRQRTWQAQRNTIMHRTLQPYLPCTYHCLTFGRTPLNLLLTLVTNSISLVGKGTEV